MTNLSATSTVLRRFDPAVLTAFGCIVVLLLIGSIVNETSCRRNTCCSSSRSARSWRWSPPA
jgi:hypothetical protein